VPRRVTEEDARGIVFDALADHGLAANIDIVKNPVNGIAGGGISQFLSPAPEPMHGIEGGIFGGPDKFKFDGAFSV